MPASLPLSESLLMPASRLVDPFALPAAAPSADGQLANMLHSREERSGWSVSENQQVP